MEVKSKSMLAKLLATEDISVEHQNVPTAMFDLKNRKIILPRWKEMSVNLYDLFVGHEISHGLETPAEGWHDAVCDSGQGFKSFLNVIEDCRIEKKVKARYPGLVKSMALGYRELMEMDFFGLKGRDMDTLPLIDKINLKFKCGAMLGINFSEEELPFITATENVDTWEDTVKVANELYEYSKTEQAMQDALEPQADEFGEDWDEDTDFESSDDYGDGEESDQDGDQSEEETQEAGSESKDEDEKSSESEEESESTDAKQGGDDIMEGTPDPESMTDKAFRNAEESLVEMNDKDIMTVNFPKIKSNTFVMQSSEVWNWTPEYREGTYWGNEIQTNNVEVENKLFNDFQTRNKSAINLLVQQFEMRRKATSLKKARENKTGMLNDKKLWAYKLTDDLFLSTTTTPDGQNHGMFMFVDMSGSMYQEMTNVVEQLLIQVSFCKKVGIPFDVYGFGNAGYYEDFTRKMLQDAQSKKSGDIYIDDENFRLLQLISSELSAPMYAKAFKGLLGWATTYINRNNRQDKEEKIWQERYNQPRHMSLSSTPLATAMLVGRDIANEFKQRNHLEVLNTIILTDGYNTDNIVVVEDCMELENTDYAQVTFRHRAPREVSEMYIKEGAISTKHVISGLYGTGNYGRGIGYQDYFLALLKHYQATTGSRMISFNIVPAKSSAVRDSYFAAISKYDYEGFQTKYKTFRSERFMEVPNAVGYDTMFMIMGGKGLEVDTEEMEVKSNSKGDLKRGFMKFAKGRSASRVFLNRFIDKVA